MDIEQNYEKLEQNAAEFVQRTTIDIAVDGRTRELLREKENQFRDLYDNAPVAYFSVSAADGSIMDCNLAAQRLSGYSKKTLNGMQVLDLYADTEYGLSRAKAVFKRFKAGERIRDVELQIKNRHGKLVWVSLSVEPLRDRNGKTIRSRSILVDISDRKRAEEALRRAHQNIKEQVEQRTAELAKANQQLKQEIKGHKQAEAALWESENNFRAMAENADDAILISASEKAFVYGNKRASDITGYSYSELLNGGFKKLLQPHDLPRIRERYRRELAGEQVPDRYGTNIVHKQGQIVPVEASSSKTIWKGQPAVIDIIRDVSERKQAAAALEESENNFRALAENANDGIFILKADGAACFANKQACEITGYSYLELLKIRFKELVHSDELDKILQKFQMRMAGKAIDNRLESKIIHKQGHVVPIEVSDSKTIWRGQPALLGIIRDITERKRVEAALRESENNFRALAENAQDGILIIESEDSYIYGNKRAKEITGYSSSELLKGGLKKLIHPDEVPLVRETLKRRMAGKQVPSRYETKIVQKGGKVVPIEVSGSKTIWHGKPAVIAIFRDITARKRMEAELAGAHNELEQRVEARTLELMEAAEKMERQHKELLHHKKELEKVNRELVDTNKALSVLARNIDRKREEAEKKITLSISSKILPLIEGLKNTKSFKNLEVDLDLLIASLNELTPGLKTGSGIIYALSSTELRVAMMIKNGLTSPEIAGLLHICLDTVKTHRRSIRRKLNISNSKINLASYLRVKMG